MATTTNRIGPSQPTNDQIAINFYATTIKHANRRQLNLNYGQFMSNSVLTILRGICIKMQPRALNEPEYWQSQETPPLLFSIYSDSLVKPSIMHLIAGIHRDYQNLLFSVASRKFLCICPSDVCRSGSIKCLVVLISLLSSMKIVGWKMGN